MSSTGWPLRPKARRCCASTIKAKACSWSSLRAETMAAKPSKAQCLGAGVEPTTAPTLAVAPVYDRRNASRSRSARKPALEGSGEMLQKGRLAAHRAALQHLAACHLFQLRDTS